VTKIPNISDILASHSNQDKTREKKVAALQERIILRMLERSVEKLAYPKRPHLKIVK
jgi:hypothetical protein